MMRNTFIEAVTFLEKYIPIPEKKHPGKLGLSRMKYLMDLLGNPQLKYPSIHVGGTSGKGSTSTIIASVLATKCKVGLTTSPHLVKINERIKILSDNKQQITNNKLDIPDMEFIALLNKITPSIEEVEKSEFGAPSYFEIVSAMAFLYFYLQKVDIAVIEVGMGGRFDATNVVKPLVAVITNVGLDHTEILGDTVEKIAVDKVGIIKQGIHLVTGVKQDSVIKIINARMQKCQNAEFSLLSRDFNYKIKSMGEEGSIFDYKGYKLFNNLKISLLGKHQVGNAALAIRAIEELNKQISKYANKQTNKKILNTRYLILNTIKDNDIRAAIKSLYIDGRLEIIKRDPLVILDGAHNPDKMKALVDSMKKIFPKEKITTIIAIKNDKNVREMLVQLLTISQKVIFTKFQLMADIGIIDSYNPKDLLQIAQTIDKGKSLLIINEAKKAVEKAVKLAKPSDLILITGSLYLVGEIKKYANMQINK